MCLFTVSLTVWLLFSDAVGSKHDGHALHSILKQEGQGHDNSMYVNRKREEKKEEADMMAFHPPMY